MFGIKKLHIFIVKQFGLLFVGTFFICQFVLMMQFLWRYVEDLIGKGLSIEVLAQFFWYMGLMLVPQAFPLAILLSSLITFGNLGESASPMSSCWRLNMAWLYRFIYAKVRRNSHIRKFLRAFYLLYDYFEFLAVGEHIPDECRHDRVGGCALGYPVLRISQTFAMRLTIYGDCGIPRNDVPLHR